MFYHKPSEQLLGIDSPCFFITLMGICSVIYGDLIICFLGFNNISYCMFLRHLCSLVFDSYIAAVSVQ